MPIADNTLGPCALEGGLDEFDLTVEFPQAIESPYTYGPDPPYEDYGSHFLYLASPIVYLKMGLWQLKWTRAVRSWDGSPHNYHIYTFGQCYLSYLAYAYPDFQPPTDFTQGFSTQWPCNSLSQLSFHDEPSSEDVNIAPPGTPAVAGNTLSCSTELIKDFGCTTCGIVWPWQLTVLAADEIYHGNAPGFFVRCVGKWLG